jgi:hypothetical protein
MQLEEAYKAEITKKNSAICRQASPTNTDCQNAPTQYQLSNVTGS